jgi:hypothetical protein
VIGQARYNYTGNFQAVLENENGQWKIYSLEITVPPAKVEDYLKSHP